LVFIATPKEQLIVFVEIGMWKANRATKVTTRIVVCIAGSWIGSRPGMLMLPGVAIQRTIAGVEICLAMIL
jgi:hypothetical protein